MDEDTVLPFDLPAVARKKVSVAFDGGTLSSDSGVLLLREVERRLGIAARLAACLKDQRAPDRIEHTLEEMLRLRMFAIAAGYEDANDCNKLRDDPVFKMAVGRAPESGEALCSQPTMSRLENACAYREFDSTDWSTCRGKSDNDAWQWSRPSGPWRCRSLRCSGRGRSCTMRS